jgi:hypothetical protein
VIVVVAMVVVVVVVVVVVAVADEVPRESGVEAWRRGTEIP